jgi:hypothetical protein
MQSGAGAGASALCIQAVRVHRSQKLRLKAGIWVSAYIRRLSAFAIPVAVTRRGDPDAGAIFVKINTLDGFAQVLRPAASGLAGTDTDRRWSQALSGGRSEEGTADAYLTRQAGFDNDMWIVEVEDRQGRHFLDECVVAE